MIRYYRLIGFLLVTGWCGLAHGQSPGVLYSWDGTGNIRNWVSDYADSTIEPPLSNTVPGELTIQELPDPVFEDVGRGFTVRDDYNLLREGSTVQGGLDLTGLTSIDFDVEHNGTGNVPVQIFVQATPSFTFKTAFFQLPPGPQTISFPLSTLTPSEQAYIRGIGLKVFEHFTEISNLTWSIKEVRSVGTPLTTRVLASHDPGSPDNGLNGVLGNFDLAAIAGNDGGQNQSGFTVNPNGSLQWTDLGGQQGAAVAWGNGTTLTNGGGSPNSFNERPTDASNYNQVTFRISATDTSNPTGQLGLQGYVQVNSAFTYTSLGNTAITTDGEYHDVSFSLSGIASLQYTMLTGLNLFAHDTDLVINVDQVTFATVAGQPGDYNQDGVVNAADYTVWRDKLGTATALPNEGASIGTVDQADYDFWKSHFGQGGGALAAAAVPEPTTTMLALAAILSGLTLRRQK